jgi:hypothetical protein
VIASEEAVDVIATMTPLAAGSIARKGDATKNHATKTKRAREGGLSLGQD